MIAGGLIMRMPLRRAIGGSPNALKRGIQVWIVRTLALLTRSRGAKRGAKDLRQDQEGGPRQALGAARGNERGAQVIAHLACSGLRVSRANRRRCRTRFRLG